jgi:xanthine dehydrogenase large subunit
MKPHHATPVGQALAHESALAQCQGLAHYTDDIAEAKGTLYAAPILSRVAHGRLLSLRADLLMAMPEVVAVIGAADIPGDRVLASFSHDEPVLVTEEISHCGQVLGLVVGTTIAGARRAAHAAQPEVEVLPAILDIDTALAQSSFALPEVTVARGDSEAALACAPHQLCGAFEAGGQEHFYLEGQIAVATPTEQGQWHITSSTQHPGEVQHWVAHALGVALHKVKVTCRRMGGGFGGKETQAGHIAVWAAVAAHVTGHPVKLRLDRDDDFLITGKRHPFAYRYRVGFDAQGSIAALDLTLLANCGHSADLSGPVADRAVFHSDNAYYLSDVTLRSVRLKTHTQSHTAFRGFGGPQGVIAIETVMGDIARHLGLDPLQVRLRNLYGPAPRDLTPYQMAVQDCGLDDLLSHLRQHCDYDARRAAVAAWNQQHPTIQRGMAITPVKFGISFTATQFNQAGALVHLYTDGSVVVHHGGTEMGQGLHTKVAQVVAHALGVGIERVQVLASDTSAVPNASATAASSGTDLNGQAAHTAALTLRERLTQWWASEQGCEPSAVCFEGDQVRTPSAQLSLAALAQLAYRARIQLWSDGFYRTPKIHYDPKTLSGRPFFYFACGAACSEVAIDTRTGESRVLRVDIVHDVGQSINPAIDRGQIEGGFVQGMGWLTSEELVWDAQGRLRTHAPSTYKIPTSADVPKAFNVELWQRPNTEETIHRSKAVGEPPFMLAISVWEALRDAVAQARGDAAVVMDAPATPERILNALNRPA